MKKNILLSLIVAGVLLSGCGQKAPEVEPIVVKQNSGVVDNSYGSEIPEDAINAGSLDGMDSVDLSSANNFGDSTQTGVKEIYFSFNKFTVSGRELDKVSANARIINQSGSNSSVKIEGNCDEWGTDEYNYALGLKRAKSAKEALVAEGVTASRVSIISYGEGKPTCSEHNDACWQRNRRADFRLMQ